MKLTIEGMHCQACVRRVQGAIVSVEGAKAQQVEIGSAVVSVDPKREDYGDYGRFGWIWDPEGNRVELWQPKAEG